MCDVRIHSQFSQDMLLVSSGTPAKTTKLKCRMPKHPFHFALGILAILAGKEAA